MNRHPMIQLLLEDVARAHKLQVNDILGKDKFAHFVAARREIIFELRAMGLKPGAIGHIMNRDRTTILEHTNPDRAAYKSRYHAANWRRWQSAREARA